MKYMVLMVFLLSPYASALLRKLFVNYGLIFVFYDVIYHLPISLVLNDMLFRSTEVGYLPNIMGRLVTTLLYFMAFYLIFKLIDKLKKRSNKA